MGDKKDFLSVIDSNVIRLDDSLRALRENIANPEFHASRVRDALKQAQEELLQIDEGNHLAELISILNQMPQYVASAWTEARNMELRLGMQLEVWREVQRAYEDVMKEPEPEPEPEPESGAGVENDFLEAVRVGEIQEPSTRTAIRRQTGIRPESLRKVRNARTIIENSPEQK